MRMNHGDTPDRVECCLKQVCKSVFNSLLVILRKISDCIHFSPQLVSGADGNSASVGSSFVILASSLLIDDQLSRGSELCWASKKLREKYRLNQTGIEQDIQKSLKILSRGLMQADYTTAYKGYKVLYQIGVPSLPALKDIVENSDWSNKKYKELSRYVTGIFSLIHDLDEDEANSIFQRLKENGLPNHIKVQLKSICAFSLKEYTHYIVRNIDVYEHKGIKCKCNIQKYIEKWLLNLPTNDLSGIHRIYVVRPDDIKAAGTYTPVLFKITIVWSNNYREGSFLFRLLSIYREIVLYHEVGHHVHRHTFGQLPDQEKEADRYAAKILRREHPKMYWLSKGLSKFGFKCEKDYYKRENY